MTGLGLNIDLHLYIYIYIIYDKPCMYIQDESMRGRLAGRHIKRPGANIDLHLHIIIYDRT